MAQADYLSNAIRALITDASPKSSTNPLRAVSRHPSLFVARSLRCRPTGRPDHLRKAFTALSAIPADTPGTLQRAA